MRVVGAVGEGVQDDGGACETEAPSLPHPLAIRLDDRVLAVHPGKPSPLIPVGRTAEQVDERVECARLGVVDEAPHVLRHEVDQHFRRIYLQERRNGGQPVARPARRVDEDEGERLRAAPGELDRGRDERLELAVQRHRVHARELRR